MLTYFCLLYFHLNLNLIILFVFFKQWGNLFNKVFFTQEMWFAIHIHWKERKNHFFPRKKKFFKQFFSQEEEREETLFKILFSSSEKRSDQSLTFANNAKERKLKQKKWNQSNFRKGIRDRNFLNLIWLFNIVFS